MNVFVNNWKYSNCSELIVAAVVSVKVIVKVAERACRPLYNTVLSSPLFSCPRSVSAMVYNTYSSLSFNKPSECSKLADTVISEHDTKLLWHSSENHAIYIYMQ